MKYAVFDSSIGNLTISSDGESITSLRIEGDRYFKEIPVGWREDPDLPLLQQAKRELEEYFSSKRKNFDLPLTAEGTPFQKQVWAALQTIPIGSTSTYARVAEMIGKPKAVRAVGTAIGRNPLCILVPCHRVLTSTGGLGGYVGGIERKQQLLSMENYQARS